MRVWNINFFFILLFFIFVDYYLKFVFYKLEFLLNGFFFSIKCIETYFSPFTFIYIYLINESISMKHLTIFLIHQLSSLYFSIKIYSFFKDFSNIIKEIFDYEKFSIGIFNNWTISFLYRIFLDNLVII